MRERYAERVNKEEQDPFLVALSLIVKQDLSSGKLRRLLNENDDQSLLDIDKKMQRLRSNEMGRGILEILSEISSCIFSMQLSLATINHRNVTEAYKNEAAEKLKDAKACIQSNVEQLRTMLR